jgi:hypothetical protein
VVMGYTDECQRLYDLHRELRESGMLTGSAGSVQISGRDVRCALSKDQGLRALPATARMALELVKLGAWEGEPHISFERCNDKFTICRPTRETMLADIANDLSNAVNSEALGSVLNQLGCSVAAKILFDAAEAKKQPPAPVRRSGPLDHPKHADGWRQDGCARTRATLGGR